MPLSTSKASERETVCSPHAKSQQSNTNFCCGVTGRVIVIVECKLGEQKRLMEVEIDPNKTIGYLRDTLPCEWKTRCNLSKIIVRNLGEEKTPTEIVEIDWQGPLRRFFSCIPGTDILYPSQRMTWFFESKPTTREGCERAWGLWRNDKKIIWKTYVDEVVKPRRRLRKRKRSVCESDKVKWNKEWTRKEASLSLEYETQLKHYLDSCPCKFCQENPCDVSLFRHVTPSSHCIHFQNQTLIFQEG